MHQGREAGLGEDLGDQRKIADLSKRPERRAGHTMEAR